MFCRCHHHNPTDLGATRKENVVEFFREELLTYARISFRNRNIARIESVSN